MAAVPPWKQALLDRKRQNEIQEKQKETEEENRLSKLPSWKRDLILKKKGTPANQNGSAVINDNMSFGSAPAVKKSESKPVPVAVETQKEKNENHENSNVQVNGKSTVTCRDVYNANIANGHPGTLMNDDEQEEELQYQPGIVSKLRNRFKTEKPADPDPVQFRRRSSHESSDVGPPSLPRPTSALITREVKQARVSPPAPEQIISREKPSRVSPVLTTPPAKPNIHDNNNIPNGTVTLDSVDGENDFSVQSCNTTKDIPRKRVSSILSVFESDKSKSQPSVNKRYSRSDLPNKSHGVTNSSVINESVARQPESQLKQSDIVASREVEGTSVTSSVLNDSKPVARDVVSVKIPDARPASKPASVAAVRQQTKVQNKGADIKPGPEVSDANLEKIRQAGSSWLFSSDTNKTSTPASQKPRDQSHVTEKVVQVPEPRRVPEKVVTVAEDKPQEEILSSIEVFRDEQLGELPAFKVPPPTLPSDNDPESGRNLTLNLTITQEAKKSQGVRASSPISSKKKVKVDKKSPTSPEKAKSPTSPSKSKPEKVSSPDKKKGFFGSLGRKDKSAKVKVIEVKTKDKPNSNPNFVVHGIDSPASLQKKRNAPSAPASKSRAPPPPKHAEVTITKPLPPEPVPPPILEETKPKANVPTSLPATERKTVVLKSDTFHISPESDDVPVTNIDDVILDSEPEVAVKAPAEDDFDYDFLDEELTIKPRPVKFASVEVIGGGVKLGRSALTSKYNKDKPEKKQLKIQFEETTPETYEYPSEQSLMESPGHPTTQTNNIGEGSGESSTDDSSDAEPPSTGTLSSNPAIGANALGGYRGKFVDDYQLGSKPANQSRDEDHVVRPRKSSVSESDSGDEVVIAPAEEDDMFNWSESNSADILF